MYLPLPRILYIVAGLAWLALLWPNPITIFLAACFSCLTLPVYRKLRLKAASWRRSKDTIYSKTRTGRFILKLSGWFPVTTYTCLILICIFSPIGILIGVVSPQALAGYAKLRELWNANLRFPHLMEYWNSFKTALSEYPSLEKVFNDAIANVESMFTNAIGMLVSSGFGVVGSTMNFFWFFFLFITLTILFSVHHRLLRTITSRIFHIPPTLLRRFLIAIYKALKAIIMGIAFVALVQGILCGIGFAFAGVSQPAFWGMLATLCAPIPMIGTALVWAPLALSQWLAGNTVAAIGLFLWGGIAINSVDNVLRPFFLKQGIDASFFVLILSILCGMAALGPVGLIAGPVLLAIAMQAYKEGNHYFNIIH